MKKHGFTLAETLITLAIIGVVAALTIPTLMKKYEKHVIETGLKKTYADLAALFKRSEVDNGPFQAWDFSLNSNDFVNKYFAPYLHLKDCHSQKQLCFAKETTDWAQCWRRPNGDLEAEGGKRVAPKYVLDDGRYIAIWNAYDSGHDWRIVNVVVDVNGSRGKSIEGIDVFLFSKFYYTYNGNLYDQFAIGNGVNGGAINYRDFALREYCFDHNDLFTCGVYIQRNGWKFPDDYPIKF